jgi:hypothetical protein
MTQIAAAPASIRAVSRLGCGVPRAEVWSRGGLARFLDLPTITSCSWGRVSNDTSLGAVTIDGQSVSADPACCSTLRQVRPWKHELHIYRDDLLVWCGPIVEVELAGDAISLRARDLSAWLDHRFVHTTHDYGGQSVNSGDTDTTTIFTDLVNDAMLPDPSPNLLLNLVDVSNVLAAGTYTPGSFKAIGPTIRDLAKGTIDWYVKQRTLTYGGKGKPTGDDATSIALVNPVFEVDTAGWVSASPGNPAICTRDTSHQRSGSGCMKVVCTAGHEDEEFIIQATASSLIVGHTYRVTGYVRGPASAPPDNWGYRWRSYHHHYWRCRNGRSSDTGYNCWWSHRTTWQQVDITFEADASTHPIQLVLEVPDGRNYEHYFDDFSIADLTPPPPPVVVLGSDASFASLRLTDDDLIAPATITLDGLGQETRSIVTNQQSGGDVAFYGEAPLPIWTLNDPDGPGLTVQQIEYGLLETATTATLADSAGAEAQAANRSQVFGTTPVRVDGFALNPDAGVTMEQLIPGALIAVELHRPCLVVSATMILRSVSVSASPDSESVALTLEPVAL